MNRIKKKILIFEPDEGLKESLKLILEPDYQLLFADDARGGGRGTLSSHKIDLFIMDVDKVTDALNAIKSIKIAYPDLKILLLSTHFELSFQEVAVKIGHSIRFQKKPFDVKDFRERIATLIRGYSLKRHKYIVRIKAATAHNDPASAQPTSSRIIPR